LYSINPVGFDFNRLGALKIVEVISYFGLSVFRSLVFGLGIVVFTRYAMGLETAYGWGRGILHIFDQLN